MHVCSSAIIDAVVKKNNSDHSSNLKYLFIRSEIKLVLGMFGSWDWEGSPRAFMVPPHAGSHKILCDASSMYWIVNNRVVFAHLF